MSAILPDKEPDAERRSTEPVVAGTAMSQIPRSSSPSIGQPIAAESVTDCVDADRDAMRQGVFGS